MDKLVRLVTERLAVALTPERLDNLLEGLKQRQAAKAKLRSLPLDVPQRQGLQGMEIGD
jgi:hypothetical protein